MKINWEMPKTPQSRLARKLWYDTANSTQEVINTMTENQLRIALSAIAIDSFPWEDAISSAVNFG